MQKAKPEIPNPFPSQQTPCYLSLSLLKPIINIAKTQKEAATKGALGSEHDENHKAEGFLQFSGFVHLRRLSGTPEQELTEALTQIDAIAGLRLKDLVTA